MAQRYTNTFKIQQTIQQKRCIYASMFLCIYPSIHPSIEQKSNKAANQDANKPTKQQAKTKPNNKSAWPEVDQIMDQKIYKN